MSKKDNPNVQEGSETVTEVGVYEVYVLPEQGVSVKARSAKEAVSKAKKLKEQEK